MCTVCILCILCVLCVSCACCPFAAPGLLWSPGLHVHCSLLRALHMPGGRLPREPVVCALRAAGVLCSARLRGFFVTRHP